MRQKSPKNRPSPSKTPFSSSPAVFEQAFLQRLGQTPTQFIHTKMKTGSDLQAVRYLYDILAAGITAQNNCMSQPFDRYYRPPVMPVSTQPEKSASPIRRMQHKLVRDKIPTLLKTKGIPCLYTTLSEENYLRALNHLFQQLMADYRNSQSFEKLADLLEVMGAIVKARGSTWEELTALRKKRKEQYGGYEKRIFLKEVNKP